MKTSEIIRIIIGFIVLALLIAATVCCALLTNMFSDDFKTFLVMRDDYIYATSDRDKFTVSESYEFKVKYVFSNVSNVNTDYNVSIYAVTDVEYCVGDDAYVLSAGTDLSEAFGVEISENSFKVSMPADFEEICSVYGGTESVAVTEFELEKYYFVLSVSSYNSKSTISISFCLCGHYADDVTLPNENIVF